MTDLATNGTQVLLRPKNAATLAEDADKLGKELVVIRDVPEVPIILAITSGESFGHSLLGHFVIGFVQDVPVGRTRDYEVNGMICQGRKDVAGIPLDQALLRQREEPVGDLLA